MQGLPRTALALLLLAVLGLAVPALGEPGMAVVITHPYPDEADPLGFPFARGVDAHLARHSFRGESMAYPHIVVDGVQVINGLPDPSRPEEALREDLSVIIEQRRLQEVPVAMALRITGTGPTVSVQVALGPRAPLDGGRLWVGLTEDHVAFRPPPAVSNGVFDHRFTLRGLQDLGSVPLDRPTTHNATLFLDPSWDPDLLAVVAWVQADASGTRFAPQEVLQAATLPAPWAQGQEVRQTERAVLVEMRSATWCDPCLFGDRIVEELAQTYGLVGDVERREPARYWQPPSNVPLVMLAALVGAAAMAWVGRRP